MGAKIRTQGSPEVDSNQLTVLTWNIAGLHPFSVERAQHIADIINKKSPDIVVLEEVINGTLALLQKSCTGYSFSEGRLVNYFNVIMAKKSKFKVGKEIVHKFEQSCMGRYLLTQELKLRQGSGDGLSLVVMACHLESLENFSEERKEQLVRCFSEMKSYASSSTNVVLAGDTNLREVECGEAGGIPLGISDAWEACGCDDTMKSTKVIREEDKGLPVKRYDRVFYTFVEEVSSVLFERIGNERIEGLGLYPSDHLGILVTFTL